MGINRTSIRLQEVLPTGTLGCKIWPYRPSLAVKLPTTKRRLSRQGILHDDLFTGLNTMYATEQAIGLMYQLEICVVEFALVAEHFKRSFDNDPISTFC